MDIGYCAAVLAGSDVWAGCAERHRLAAEQCVADVLGERLVGVDSLALARDAWRALEAVRPGEEMPVVRMRRPDALDGGKLVRLVLHNRAVGRRALVERIPVETAVDAELASAVRSMVERSVSAAHVAVEVNPSSNLVVGGLAEMYQQPTFHEAGLPIVFDADDPLTFGTSLGDEQAYAWAGMVVAGLSAKAATQRLDDAAASSRRFAFCPKR